MTDYLDRLIGDPTAVDADRRTEMFGPMLSIMVVGRRAASSAEIDEMEASYLDELRLPLPFWDSETGDLEPLSHFDFQTLQAAGVSPDEWTILVLSDHLKEGIENE